MSDQELKLMKKELLKNGYTDLPKWKGNNYCHFLTTEGTEFMRYAEHINEHGIVIPNGETH